MVGDHRLRVPRERIFAHDEIAEDAGGLCRLRLALGGNRRVEFVRKDPAGAGILEPVEECARDPERRGNDAAGVARVHALGQHFHA